MDSADAASIDTHWPIEGSGFLRIVLGPREEKPYRGGRARLLAAEMYREGIVLTWLVDSLPREIQEGVMYRADVEAELVREDTRSIERGLSDDIRERSARSYRYFLLTTNLSPAAIRATDELGNEYRTTKTGAQGFPTIRGTTHLVPGLDSRAHQLAVELDEAVFLIDV